MNESGRSPDLHLATYLPVCIYHKTVVLKL